MLDHPGGSTHPVSTLTDVWGNSAPHPFDLTVDDAGHLHFDLRVPNCTMIETFSPLGVEAITAAFQVVVGWDTFTLIPS